MRRLVLFIFFSISFTGISLSQSTYYGAGLGYSFYWGDLNSPSFFKNIANNGGIALQVQARHHFNDYFSVKGSAIFGRVRANDANSNQEWQLMRNISFKSVLNELSAHLEFYPLRFSPNTNYYNWSPYLSFGLGGFYFNPIAELNGNEIELQPLGTEGQGMPGFEDKYNRIALSLSIGGGIAVRFSERVIIHADILGKWTTTDYIDDISTIYVNYDQLRNSPTNGLLAATLADRTNEYLGISEPLQRETGTQRGGSSVNDYYFTTMISFAVKLNDNSGYRKGSKKGIDCPKF